MISIISEATLLGKKSENKPNKVMLTLSLLLKVNSKTEWSAVLNEDIVEGKRVLCIDEVLDMVL